MELRDLGISDMNSEIVEKLSGDNTKEEKQRVMDLFNSGCVHSWFRAKHFLTF